MEIFIESYHFRREKFILIWIYLQFKYVHKYIPIDESDGFANNIRKL